MLLFVWLLVFCISFTGALHEDDIQSQMVTPEEYLTQVTESVNTELEKNSMFAHKPPTRWYKTSHDKKHPNIKLEQALALTLVRHYNYLVHLRHELRKINNELADRVDLWPLRPINPEVPGETPPNGSHTDANRFVGWKQPEWMDDLFNGVEEMGSDVEDLIED